MTTRQHGGFNPGAGASSFLPDCHLLTAKPLQVSFQGGEHAKA